MGKPFYLGGVGGVQMFETKFWMVKIDPHLERILMDVISVNEMNYYQNVSICTS